jgi:hypothetical protein
MNWFPQWSSIIGAAIVIAVAQTIWRVRRIRGQFTDHRVARFFDWPIDGTGGPTKIYWLEGVTRADIEIALYGSTDGRWGWLCRPTMRRVLVIANPVSWALTIYGATNGPLSLGFSDSALSYWGLLPIPLWLAVRRSVRLIADAPTELLDERLVAMRDRTYLLSYRWVAMVIGVAAALLIIVNDMINLSVEALNTQLILITASAYTAIWAIPALPSVILAWTLRNEHPVPAAD